MSYKQKIGNLGEKLAQKFLISKGYRILGTNFKVRGGEVDIIARKGKWLIFVEVKTRTNQNFGYPEESFDFRKRQRFQKAVFRYLSENRHYGSWRVDLISLEIDKITKKAKLRHYQAVELE